MNPKLRGSQNKGVLPRPALSRLPGRVQPLTLPQRQRALPWDPTRSGWSAPAAGLLGAAPSGCARGGQGTGPRLWLFSRFLLQPRGNPEVAAQDWAPFRFPGAQSMLLGAATAGTRVHLTCLGLPRGWQSWGQTSCWVQGHVPRGQETEGPAPGLKLLPTCLLAPTGTGQVAPSSQGRSSLTTPVLKPACVLGKHSIIGSQRKRLMLNIYVGEIKTETQNVI